ncbi:hypothetical protein [Gracilibacillus sp. YIM 98692]|uniref:hypothetical protein n=1 Tax=Gracilibacillus sp. YIM 98692 TaxID=2663532 RepID=UPI00196A142B|nr:hypothetical protein [Gracilibacillus sp. YIM 98692]
MVAYEFAREYENVAKMDIAATYKDAIELNREKIEGKLKFYKLGLRLLTWGFIIFIIHFLIEEVIKYVI